MNTNWLEQEIYASDFPEGYNALKAIFASIREELGDSFISLLKKHYNELTWQSKVTKVSVITFATIMAVMYGVVGLCYLASGFLDLELQIGLNGLAVAVISGLSVPPVIAFFAHRAAVSYDRDEREFHSESDWIEFDQIGLVIEAAKLARDELDEITSYRH